MRKNWNSLAEEERDRLSISKRSNREGMEEALKEQNVPME